MYQQRRETLSLSAPFRSPDGKRYLNTIIKHILPTALWRTWYTAVDALHALDAPCCIDTAELAHQAAVSQRQIERDLQKLEARGLMRRYAARKECSREDGTTFWRAVIIKDFSGLYDLASEYHLWSHSEEHIPPERDFADFIKADPQLYTKLIRFDNYRHVLCCKKPGPKRQPSSDDYGPWI
jgi:DNA-binding transcriptional ArsR family regulator